MNQRTKEEFQKFIDQVCILAQGCVHLTGMADCARLVEAANDLRYALEHDDTIKEL